MLVWNLQWLNHNSQRAYPLTDWATAQDTTGAITLPTDFLVSLYWPTHCGLNVQPERFFLSGLGIYPTGYNLNISYDDGTSNPPLVATVNIAKSSHTENMSYALPGVNDYDDCVGSVTIGSLTGIEDLPAGQYTFTRAGGALEVDCIRPMIRGISALIVGTGAEQSERLYGDIVLVAGSNIRIVASQSTHAGATITISAIKGEGLNEVCDCYEVDNGSENVAPCIRYINGIPPLPDGNFRIIGNDAMEISGTANGLQLTDTASKPCCGCAELDAIVKQIDRFADGVAILHGFANRLGTEVAQMGQVVLGSRIGDNRCIECAECEE